MDIVELKSAWAILQQDIVTSDNVDENKILNSIHGKSKSEISKIKRGLHLKFIIAFLTIIIATGLAMTSFINTTFNPLEFIFSPIESAVFYMIMAILISIMVYFNYQAYSQIKNLQQSSLNLKNNLKSFIETMRKAMTFNIFSDTLMTPIIFTWVFYAYAFKEQQLGFNFMTILLFILPILIGLLSFVFQRFMQRLKFGRYLDRLTDYLDSLEKNSKDL